MTEDIQRVKETSIRSGDTMQKTTELSSPQDASRHQQNVVDRVIWFIAGTLLVLLAFRFLLSLLGANNNNVLADFVYSTSRPFVAPFFSLFKYNSYRYSAAHFEIYTLVAILFYAVVAWGFSRLITLNRD